MMHRQILRTKTLPHAMAVRLMLVQDVSECYDIRPGPVVFIVQDDHDGSETVIIDIQALGEFLRKKGSSVQEVVGHDADALEMIVGLEIDDRVVSDVSVHQQLFFDVPDYVEGPQFFSDRVVFWIRQMNNQGYQRRVLSFHPLGIG